MSQDELTDLFNKYINKTKNKEFIHMTEITVGNIPSNAKSQLKTFATKVHITSIALKHIYDKHLYKNNLEDEFLFVLKNIRNVVGNPDLITLNKPNRKADYCFIKTVDSKTILTTIQMVNKKLYIVTAFVLKDQGYMKGTSIIWKF